MHKAECYSQRCKNASPDQGFSRAPAHRTKKRATGT